MNNLDVGEKRPIRGKKDHYLNALKCLVVVERARLLGSHSEPMSAPPGHKVLATAMEIGLVRDFVDKSLGFHDRLLESGSLVQSTLGLFKHSPPSTTSFRLARSTVWAGRPCTMALK
jgi:hypothetical protein